MSCPLCAEKEAEAVKDYPHPCARTILAKKAIAAERWIRRWNAQPKSLRHAILHKYIREALDGE